MSKYAYRIYKNALNHPIIGGTVTAENMEQAAQRVIESNGVEVVHESHYGQEYHSFMFRGSKVGEEIGVKP